MASSWVPSILTSLVGQRAKKAQHATEAEGGDLWNKLPGHLQENVFARLSLPGISSLPCLSWACMATYQLSSFRRLCDEALPKMIAIVGYVWKVGLTIAAFDFTSGRWHYRVLSHLVNTDEPQMKIEWGNASWALFAHGGGLLCFVPFNSYREQHSIVVCNPLTNEWKTLPFQDMKGKIPVLLQLAVDGNVGRYKVTLVYRNVMRGEIFYTANVYDSENNLWSEKDALVYGVDDRLCRPGPKYSQYYKCSSGNDLIAAMKLEHQIERLNSWKPRAEFVNAGKVNERIFQVKRHQTTYTVSEFVRDSAVEEGLREINSYESPLQVMKSPNNVRLMASESFLLLIVDNGRKDPYRRRMMSVCDLTTHKWHEIPTLKNEYTLFRLGNHFMCELRWGASP